MQLPNSLTVGGTDPVDLNIVAPGQLFVSGMGLESEWRADMRVAGTSQAPRITGTIDLVRGTLGFAGRSFELQEGRVRFNGGGASDATVAMQATESIEDVDVTVNVAGNALDPRITFTSSPVTTNTARSGRVVARPVAMAGARPWIECIP